MLARARGPDAVRENARRARLATVGAVLDAAGGRRAAAARQRQLPAVAAAPEARAARDEQREGQRARHRPAVDHAGQHTALLYA
eukprot:COSAG06_NODE_2554_length_6676_cov_11.776646_1_plen_84_part_00